jgi:hypothetical protein
VLVGTALAVMLAVGLGSARGAKTAGSGLTIPKGYELLQLRPGATNPDFRMPDGGGLVTTVQQGLTASSPHQRSRLHCRLQSVDRSGKTPYQSDPLGTCDLYLPAHRPITLIARPDFRSTTPTWQNAFNSYPLLSSCPNLNRGRCGPSATVHAQLVPSKNNTLFVGFWLRLFRLTVTNTDPSFGEAEDHGRQQVPNTSPIDCGLGHTTCSALYEYGTKPVLDALWDISRSLTVTWDGCDPADPIRSNPALCPVTMTRNRQVTISWP